MRFDISVNALTINALTKKKIIVFGGSQIRPNIHIDDITDLYLFLIKTRKKFTGIYNAGFENISIKSMAKIIQKKLKYKIKIISFEANIPTFYKNTIKIIESLEKKFFLKLNLRKNNDYEFYFDVNVDTKKIKEVLSKKVDVFEVFVFTE